MDIDLKKEAQKNMTSSTDHDHQKEGVNEVATNAGGRTSDSSTSFGFFYQHKTKDS